MNQQILFIHDLDYNENKKKSEQPEFNIDNLDAFPKQFEAFYKDHFSLRGYFLKQMGWVFTHIWNKSPKPDRVIIGKDKWLYNVDKELDCYMGKRNFDKKQLNEILEEFKYRKRILDSMDIKMLVVINATKYSVYPENLPSFLISENSFNTGTQLIKYCRDNSDIVIIYSKDILMPLKQNYQLFLKCDNHWSDIAGYFVAKEIVNHIDSEIQKIPLKEFCKDTLFNHAGNLANMMANTNEFSETIIKLSLCNNDAQNFNRITHIPLDNVGYKDEFQFSFKSDKDSLPDAVIIRDSFGNALMPYLKNSFYHSTFIWDGWNYGFNLEVIEKEKPDVVIYMILESLLPSLYSKGLSKK